MTKQVYQLTRPCPGLGLGLGPLRPALLEDSKSSQSLSCQDLLQNGFAWSSASSFLGMLFNSNCILFGKKWRKMNEVSRQPFWPTKWLQGPAPSEPLTGSLN